MPISILYYDSIQTRNQQKQKGWVKAERRKETGETDETATGKETTETGGGEAETEPPEPKAKFVYKYET